MKRKIYGDDLNDNLRPGRPEAGNRAELVAKVCEIIAIDANFTVKNLAEELNISKNTICRILTEDFCKTKKDEQVFYFTNKIS